MTSNFSILKSGFRAVFWSSENKCGKNDRDLYSHLCTAVYLISEPALQGKNDTPLRVDAQEQALEFALKPPTETRLEEQYALSQNLVPDLLLHGHKDPDIRAFVTKYLRYLDDKRDDIKADIEGVKFARMIELDTAAIFGAEAQGEGIAGPTHYAAQASAISARQVALLRARMHSIKLAALHGQGNLLRVTMRQLNSFFTEVMEGAVSNIFPINICYRK